jgi:outer membrane lipoprotein-sorting protein
LKSIAPISLIALTLGLAVSAHAGDAQQLVADAFDYWRGQASVAEVEMTIHRPAWERTMLIKAWTRGQKDSLFFILEPPRDQGNGTLKKGREMWMYNPKVNRVIKIPPSMMSQSWMGSDFSNNDLAKSDSLLEHYDHRIVGTSAHEGKRVYRIESMPKPQAPVVWGMQQLEIREDLIFLEEVFFDEELQPVKSMTAHEITLLGGRLFPKVWVMRKTDQAEEYTRLNYRSLEFKSGLPDSIFTLSNLKNPQR